MSVEHHAFHVTEHLPALAAVVPLVGAVLAALVRNGTIAWLVSLAVGLALPVISILMLWEVQASGPISYALGGWAPPVGIEFRVDLANAYLAILVSVMAGVVLAGSPRSIDDEVNPENRAWYYAAFLLCLCGLMGMIVTGDAFNVFVFMEVSSLATYILIAMGRDRRALVAAYQYLIIGTVGATFYVIGVGLLLAMTGTLNLVDLAQRLPQIEATRPLFTAVAFIIVGLGLKLALFPMHLWLPNAYAYAPSSASAFVASTATKVAVYLLLRFTFSVYGVDFVLPETPAATLFMILASVAMISGSLSAIFQTNVKRMLAYSSVSQIGYIILGIAMISETGLTGGISHMFNHALIKGALFIAVAAVIFATGAVRIDDMAGLGRTMPVTMGAFVIAGLGLIGVPGTAGFISKWYLIQGAAEQGMWWIVAVIVVSSLMAVFYIGRVVEVAWFRAPLSDAPRRAPPELVLAAVALAVAVVIFGFFTEFSAGVASDAARVLLEGYAR
ncbi:monovalent cation/H+ antiporter subunit D family protein [Limibaculum sp. M0105]|uniref:Monovalent cation/H+ antiporter subunit D family protein n=1 Tax=Thermohalobaculum xanthum TaxID=2753746 RepID=A0A8J7M4F7_9RHOB|nr:monovalent cation/H+ antiporter subunit D family protein [Thermohalobaculum xanthum]MBK0398084.1 monovalent cation/H+ antiporter subunit D family protein [Thermohalobaculum xanthum]